MPTLNESNNVTILDRIIEERIKNSSPELAFQEFKYYVDLASVYLKNNDIQIDGGIKEKYRENVYVVNKLISLTKEKIRIFTDRIDDSIYGSIGVIANLNSWFDKEEGRGLYILLKREQDLKNTDFYKEISPQHINKIHVSKCKIPGIIKCRKNVALFDNSMFKLKYFQDDEQADKNRETILVNFNSESTAKSMVNEYDRVFNNHHLTGECSGDFANSVDNTLNLSMDRGISRYPYYMDNSASVAQP